MKYCFRHHHRHENRKYHPKTGHNHGEGAAIDLYSYSSKIRHWNPAFKVSFSFLTIILCILFDNPYVSAAVIIAMAYLTIIKGGLTVHKYFSVLMIPLTFILIGTITIGVDFSKQPIGQFNLFIGFGYLFTSKAKLKTMVFLILKVFAAISALQMMTLSTPSSEIISVLRKARVPKIIIELMHMIYRYIFILMSVFVNMKNSAESRLGYCDFKTSCYTFGSIGSNILIISMKKANIFYEAMESRCFDGDLIFLEEYQIPKIKHVVWASIFMISLTALWYFTL